MAIIGVFAAYPLFSATLFVAAFIILIITVFHEPTLYNIKYRISGNKSITIEYNLSKKEVKNFLKNTNHNINKLVIVKA